MSTKSFNEENEAEEERQVNEMISNDNVIEEEREVNEMINNNNAIEENKEKDKEEDEIRQQSIHSNKEKINKEQLNSQNNNVPENEEVELHSNHESIKLEPKLEHEIDISNHYSAHSKPNEQYQDFYQEEYNDDDDEEEHQQFNEDRRNVEENNQEDQEEVEQQNQHQRIQYMNNDQQDEYHKGDVIYKEDGIINSNSLNKQIDEHEMESISEVENEEGDHHRQINIDKSSESALLIKEDYNQVFDEIMKKNKQNLIFKEDNNNKFKPLTMMQKQSPYNNNLNYSANNKQYNNSKDSTKSINDTSNRHKVPIEFMLYDEASKRREKVEKTEYNNMMNIILTSSKPKISNNSHKIAISKVEKRIEEIVAKREKNKHLTFINIGEIFTELNIFREIFPKSNNSNDNGNKSNRTNSKSKIINTSTYIKNEDNNNNLSSSSTNSFKRTKTYQNYKEIQKEMINVKENEKRKQSEINFYEQFWLVVNPGNKHDIKSDMICEILKILFAPINSNIKDISEIFKQFLMTAFFLNCNPEEVKRYISPITEKDIPEEDIWQIERVVKEFLQLKENSIAYQNLKHFNKTIQSDMIRSDKEMSFKPKILGNGQKWNYYEERLPALVERERIRLQVLEEMKKESEEADFKECTFKPEINHPNKKRQTMNNDINESKSNDIKPIYERLHKSNAGREEKLTKEKIELQKQEDTKTMAECSFKPKLISDDSFKKSINTSEYPKGFQEYVTKMHHGIIKANKKKYNERRIPRGENYEKVRSANIQPFNITDLQKKDMKQLNKKQENFFTIQIKIPTGKERTIKIFLTDDPYDVADNFCKTYCLKEEIKERLAKTILNFRTMYLQKNHIEDH